MHERPPPHDGNDARGRRRGLAWVAAIAGLVALLLVAAVLFVLNTESGARLAWQAATKAVPGQLSGEFAGGTLADGIHLRNVVYEDATKRVKIDRLDGAWRWYRSPLTLVIPSLRMNTVDVTLLPGPAPAERSGLPAEIRLPLAIELQQAAIQEILVHDDGATSRYSDVLLRASSDRVQHALDLENAVTPWGKANASLRLNGEPPFAVGGTARLAGAYREKPYQLAAHLSGSLREPQIRVDASGEELAAHAAIDATPFAAVPLRRAEVTIRHLNPGAFKPDWPQADIELHATLVPVENASARGLSVLAVAGPVALSNANPGPIDKALLPLVSARAEVVLDAQHQRFSQLAVTLAGKGRIEGSGELQGADRGRLALQADEIDLHALHTALRSSQLSGPLNVTLSGETQQVSLQLDDPSFSVKADAQLDPGEITLQSAQLQSGKARLAISGRLGRGDAAAYAVKGTLADFNPALFLTSARTVPPRRSAKAKWQPADARINMAFSAEGALRPVLDVKLDFDIDDSTYAGLPMTGGGILHLVGERLLPSDAQVSIAGNEMQVKGSFGQPSDRLRLDIDAPALARLGFGLSGAVAAHGTAGGTLQRPVVDADFRANKLAFGEHRVASLSGEVHTQGVPGTAPDARIALDLDVRALQSGDIRLARLAVGIDGTYAKHTINLASAGRVRGRPLDLKLAAQGRLQELPQGMAWDGILGTLKNTGFPRLSLGAPLSLSLASGSVELGATQLTVERALIDLKHFRYANDALRSEGGFRSLEIAHLLELRRQITGETAPFKTDLVLDGSWDVTLADSANGFVQVERRRGDLVFPRSTGEISLGLRTLFARADLQGKEVALDGRVVSARFGSVNGQGRIALRQVDRRLAVAPDAPVSGRILASVPRLQAIGVFAGPDMAIDGSAEARLEVGGTVADPKLSGTIAGDRLSVVLYDQGIRLRDGVVRLGLENNVVELREVVFHGGDGTLRASGQVPLDRAARNLRATITADKLQLLSNPSGQMTISGQAEARNTDGQLAVNGKFTVDRALFDLPEKSAPKLDDDVVVVRGGKQQDAEAVDDDPVPGRPQPPGPFSPRVEIQVDLGDDFYFEGSGAELRLAGTLVIRSAPNEPVRAFGTVRIAEGSYEAFGTELAIERGVLNFQGPFDNPNLNILAMRRDQEVAAGVQVTGTAQNPRVQLVSEPSVPDEEKLSWLVFGSAGGSDGQGQAQAAAKGAALGLLNKFGGERVAERFGLDELSIGESEFGLDGAQVVNLGKEISDRLYIGYEQSLASAESVLKLTYELTRNWSVVLRGGAVTGLELFFSKRFDSFR